MLFPITYILALVSLLVIPVLSAPINLQDASSVMTSHPVHAGLEKRSSMSGGHPHHRRSLPTILERDLQEYDNLVARDEASVLEARSFDEALESELAKRKEGPTMMRLVRRKSIFTKIKEGFQVTTLRSSHDMS